jgi:hypothetical protein
MLKMANKGGRQGGGGNGMRICSYAGINTVYTRREKESKQPIEGGFVDLTTNILESTSVSFVSEVISKVVDRFEVKGFGGG